MREQLAPPKRASNALTTQAAHLPGRALAEESGGSSSVTLRTPQAGASRGGGPISALTPASMEVRPTLARAEPCALLTTPSATLRRRGRGRGLSAPRSGAV